MSDLIEECLQALSTVIDPDVGQNIVALGLLETLDVGDHEIRVGLIMTTPACPQSGYLVDQSFEALRAVVPEDRTVTVELLKEPLWHPERMSFEARLALGWM